MSLVYCRYRSQLLFYYIRMQSVKFNYLIEEEEKGGFKKENNRAMLKNKHAPMLDILIYSDVREASFCVDL